MSVDATSRSILVLATQDEKLYAMLQNMKELLASLALKKLQRIFNDEDTNDNDEWDAATSSIRTYLGGKGFEVTEEVMNVLLTETIEISAPPGMQPPFTLDPSSLPGDDARRSSFQWDDWSSHGLQSTTPLLAIRDPKAKSNVSLHGEPAAQHESVKLRSKSNAGLPKERKRDSITSGRDKIPDPRPNGGRRATYGGHSMGESVDKTKTSETGRRATDSSLAQVRQPHTTERKASKPAKMVEGALNHDVKEVPKPLVRRNTNVRVVITDTTEADRGNPGAYTSVKRRQQ
ncbi:hypothetical protein HK101_002500 [Irineochytrium annulatum]|nr:hypothetical protein HK101_002500 [Irineochytrium annulatum]